MKLKINYRTNLENLQICRLNNMLLDNQRIKEEIEKGLKKGYFKANKNANITPKLNGIQLLEGSS